MEYDQPISSTGSHDEVVPIPYRVDFCVESKGRKFGDTKRRIKWKFGFAHSPALFPHLHDADGNYVGGSGDNKISEAKTETGVDCRGREHEIILTWSILTGKSNIYCDGKEVFRSGGREDVGSKPFSKTLSRGFQIPNSNFNGDHRIELRCFAKKPKNGETLQQYKLMVDGVSYFDMPDMLELGTDLMWSKVERLKKVDDEEAEAEF